MIKKRRPCVFAKFNPRLFTGITIVVQQLTEKEFEKVMAENISRWSFFGQWCESDAEAKDYVELIEKVGTNIFA